jgi:PAS domain S-box-containing protein
MKLTARAQDAQENLSPVTIDTAPVEAVVAALSLELAAVSDTEFLSRCALALSRAIEADFVIISRLNPYSNIMRSLRFAVDGAEAENIAYSLDGTPCARAVDDATCCVYPENVADLFPHDKFLVDYGINGYAGAALHSARGETLGVVLALTKQPIRNANAARVVLERFRLRIASAIETSETSDRNQWAVTEATDGVWDWDVVTGGTILSPSIQELLGYSKRGPYDISQVEDAMHPQDRALHSAALREHLSAGTPFNVNIRLRDAAGEYRWFRSRGKAVRNEKGRPVRVVGCFIEIDDLMKAAGENKPNG